MVNKVHCLLIRVCFAPVLSAKKKKKKGSGWKITSISLENSETFRRCRHAGLLRNFKSHYKMFPTLKHLQHVQLTLFLSLSSSALALLRLCWCCSSSFCELLWTTTYSLLLSTGLDLSSYAKLADTEVLTPWVWSVFLLKEHLSIPPWKINKNPSFLSLCKEICVVDLNDNLNSCIFKIWTLH